MLQLEIQANEATGTTRRHTGKSLDRG
jgi:hypothetical protein